MVVDAPKSENIPSNNIVDIANPYNPKSSGIRSLANIIVNRSEPIFAVRSVVS